MMKLYLLFSLLALQTFSFGQNYSRIWETLYTDSTADLMHISNTAVDAWGNNYLAGYKIYQGGNYYDTHLFLIKITSAGFQEWIRYFDNSTDSIDAPYGLALDVSGNVYVTAARIDTFCNICTHPSKVSDIITMKYDGAGNRIWLNRYHDSVYKLAQPSHISVSTNGTIIVTGSDDTKSLVQKINSNGKTVWIRKFNDLVLNTACFDSQENIIIGGASNPDHLYQTEKPMVMKMSSHGNELWSSTYDEYRKNGRFHFVNCDSANNIYANGQTDTIAFYNNPKIITVKYNDAGAQQWSRKEEDHSITLPNQGDFKLDPAGNSFISGYIDLSSINEDWLTTKYNSSGSRQWIAHYDDSLHGSDRPAEIALGAKGFTYVTGYSATTSGYEILTIAYNNSGKIYASDIYKPARRSNGFASGIGLDQKGNIYVSGEVGFKNNPSPYVAVVKYGVSRSLQTTESGNTIAQLEIYPNPVINTVNIVAKTSVNLKNCSLTIKDIEGKVLLHETVPVVNLFYRSIDVHGLKPGIYSVCISNGISTVGKTFIKQ